MLLIERHCGPGERVVGVDFLSLGRRDWCVAAVTDRHLFLAQDKGVSRLAGATPGGTGAFPPHRQSDPHPDNGGRRPDQRRGAALFPCDPRSRREPIWSPYVGASGGARLDALLDRLAGGQRPKSAQRQERERMEAARRRAQKHSNVIGGILAG